MGFNLKQFLLLITSPGWRTEEYTDSELEEMMKSGDEEAAQQQETQNANSWEEEPAADDSGWVADPGLGLNDTIPTWSQPDDSGSDVYSNTGLNDFTSQEVSLDTQAYSDYVQRLKDEADAKASAMAAEYAASQAETSGDAGIDWESYQNNGLNDFAPTRNQPDDSGSNIYSDTGLNDFTEQEGSLDTQAYADYVRRLKDEAAAKRSALEEEYAASQAETSGGAGIDWESYQNNGLNDFTPTWNQAEDSGWVADPNLGLNDTMPEVSPDTEVYANYLQRLQDEAAAPEAIANIRDSQYNSIQEAGTITDNGTGIEVQDYIKKALKQVIQGNYTDDVTLLGTAAQVCLGLAGADLPMDIRDLTYDVTHWKSTPEHVLQTLLDLAALLPVVGDLKYMDEVGALAKGMAKNADEAGALTKGILKYGDEAAEVADDAVKTAIKGVDEAGEAVKDGAKIADEVVTEGAGENLIVQHGGQITMALLIPRLTQLYSLVLILTDMGKHLVSMLLQRERHMNSALWRQDRKIVPITPMKLLDHLMLRQEQPLHGLINPAVEHNISCQCQFKSCEI